MPSSIFFEFTLPNSASWFYFSLFLTVSLFFQFSRLFTLRNLDLLALFLFVPGFLLIQEANQFASHSPSTTGEPGQRDLPIFAAQERIAGYAWLLSASLYWFVRCLVDLATIRRPLISPNLSTPGLIWFGSALLVCLTGVAFSRSTDPWETVGKRPVALTGVQEGATAVVAEVQAANGSPTQDVQFWVERTFAMLCHVAVVTGLLLIGMKHFHDTPTGVAAGTMYLLLPYAAYHIGQVHHVWPAALILWAIFFYRRPTLAGMFIGIAAGTTFFPLLILPVWIQFYRPRGLGRFMVGFTIAWLIGLATTLFVLRLAGHFPDGMWQTLHLEDWQPWRIPKAESIWTGVYWAYRIPVFILYVAFVLTSLFWAPVRNLGHLLALTAAMTIGVQFWFADRGGLYVLWYAPFLVLMVLRPNLADLQPVDPGPWPKFFGRVGRWLYRRVWPFRLPRTVSMLSR